MFKHFGECKMEDFVPIIEGIRQAPLEDETPATAETFIDALTIERDNLRAELAAQKLLHVFPASERDNLRAALAAAKRATENMTTYRDAIKLQLANAAKGILSIIDEDLDRRVSEMVEEHVENINWENHADNIQSALPDWDIGEYTDNINDACKDNLRDLLQDATVRIEL